MRSITRSAVYAMLVAAVFAVPAHADVIKIRDIVITKPWSRATPNGAKIAGGYLTIENTGLKPERLLGGASEIAAKIEVHEMTMDGGVMKMRSLDDGLTIEAGETVKLAPGGLHLMMFDLKGQLKQGDRVPITLEFEKTGKVTVMLDVQGVGAPGPGDAANSPEQDKAQDHSGHHNH